VTNLIDINTPEKVPDHSYLDCVIEISHSNVNPLPIRNGSKLSKYNANKTPADFLMSDSDRNAINDAISQIDYKLNVLSEVNATYDVFQSFLCSEMENAGMRAKERNHNITQMRKSLYKSYWNNVLQHSLDNVCETDKVWTKFSGNCNVKRRLKHKYCIERKSFDKLHRQYKSRYQSSKQCDLNEKLNKSNSRDFWRISVKLEFQRIA